MSFISSLDDSFYLPPSSWPDLAAHLDGSVRDPAESTVKVRGRVFEVTIDPSPPPPLAQSPAPPPPPRRRACCRTGGQSPSSCPPCHHSSAFVDSAFCWRQEHNRQGYRDQVAEYHRLPPRRNAEEQQTRVSSCAVTAIFLNQRFLRPLEISITSFPTRKLRRRSAQPRSRGRLLISRSISAAGGAAASGSGSTNITLAFVQAAAGKSMVLVLVLVGAWLGRFRPTRVGAIVQVVIQEGEAWRPRKEPSLGSQGRQRTPRT